MLFTFLDWWMAVTNILQLLCLCVIIHPFCSTPQSLEYMINTCVSPACVVKSLYLVIYVLYVLYRKHWKWQEVNMRHCQGGSKWMWRKTKDCFKGTADWDWMWSGDLLIPFDQDRTNASEDLPVSNHTGRWKGAGWRRKDTDGQGFSSLL